MSAAELLGRLEAAGVTLALNPAGDGLTLSGWGTLAPDLLDAVRADRAALIEALAPAKEDRPRSSSSPDWEVIGQQPGHCESCPLPGHLAALVSRARAGKVTRSPAMLASGLVPDLSVYVLAWAEAWPHDRAHVLRRLEEAHAPTAGL